MKSAPSPMERECLTWSPEMTDTDGQPGKVTFRGVELEFQPPCSDDDDERLLVLGSTELVERANRSLVGWRWEQIQTVEGIPVYELKKVADGQVTE